MMIIGCDFHPGFQQVAMFDTDTAEVSTRRLEHPEQAREFYRSLARPARIGMEACGQSQWFERLLQEVGHELWIGDPAQIRARAVRQQKTDRRDAQHLLELLLSERFPRLWVPSAEERDARQLLITPVERFQRAKQVSSYLGLIPREHSSGGRQKLGSISKQGSPFLRFLLVEAAQSAARHDEQLHRCYLRLAVKKGRAKAKVAVARKLATRLYWMLRQENSHAQH